MGVRSNEVKQMEYMKYVGEYCRCYRAITLNMTLKRMSELTDINMKTISAFENGRSTNMEHFFEYCQLGNDTQRQAFIKGFADFMGLK
jgi:cytoskeletal protein RodZ